MLFFVSELVATTELLQAVRVRGATLFSLEMSDDGEKFEQATIGSARTKYFPLSSLSCEWIAEQFDPEGVYRLTWHRASTKRELGQIGPFVLGDEGPETARSLEQPIAEDEPAVAHPPAEPRHPAQHPPQPLPGRNSGREPAARVAAALSPRAISALSAEQLKALLYAQTNHDETPIGQFERILGSTQGFVMAQLEAQRLSAQERVEQARAEAARAAADAERRALERERFAQVSYERTRELDERALELERTRSSSESQQVLAELRAELSELAESQEQTVQQVLARVADEHGLEQAQRAAWVQSLAPVIPRVVELLARAAGSDGRVAGQVASAAAAGAAARAQGGGSAAELFDAIQKPQDAAE